MKTLKTLTIAAAMLAGAATLAMAQNTTGGMANPAGATAQPGSRSGSSANDQKAYKAPNDKKQDYSPQGAGAPVGK